VTSSYFPNYASTHLRTILEFNKHTTQVMNLSLNHPMAITAYLCKPRKWLTSVEFPSSEVVFNKAGTMTLPTAGLIMKDLVQGIQANARQNNGVAFSVTPQQPNTWEAQKLASGAYMGYPTNGASVIPVITQDPATGFGTDLNGIFEAGASLFNQRWFCERFKILRVKKFALGPGKKAKLTLTMPPQVLSATTLGMVQTERKLTGGETEIYKAPYVMYPHTRFWMCSFHGTPAPYTETGLNNLKAFDVPAAVVGMYHVEQWCVRNQPVVSGQSMAFKTSQLQNVATTDGPYSFGRVAYVGEGAAAGTGQIVQGRGAVIGNIATS